MIIHADHCVCRPLAFKLLGPEYQFHRWDLALQDARHSGFDLAGKVSACHIVHLVAPVCPTVVLTAERCFQLQSRFRAQGAQTFGALALAHLLGRTLSRDFAGFVVRTCSRSIRVMEPISADLPIRPGGCYAGRVLLFSALARAIMR